MVKTTTYNKRQREAIETLVLCFGICSWEHFQRCTTYKSSPAALVNALANKKPWALKLVDIYQEFYGGTNE